MDVMNWVVAVHMPSFLSMRCAEPRAFAAHWCICAVAEPRSASVCPVSSPPHSLRCLSASPAPRRSRIAYRTLCALLRARASAPHTRLRVPSHCRLPGGRCDMTFEPRYVALMLVLGVILSRHVELNRRVCFSLRYALRHDVAKPVAGWPAQAGPR